MVSMDEWIRPFQEEIKRMTFDVDVQRILKVVQQIDRKFASTAVTKKLRKTPKRATKFSVQLKALINSLKLVARSLSPESQTEIYPAFGVLLQHYINVVLLSTFGAKGNEKNKVKRTAEFIIGYVKIILNGEAEWTLDVILSSNAKRSQDQDSLGYWLLHSILTDSIHYSYSLEDVETFTKFLAVGKFLLKSNKREYGLSPLEVVEYLVPTTTQSGALLRNISKQKKLLQKQHRRINKSHLGTLLLQTKSNQIVKECRQRLTITLEIEEEDDSIMNDNSLILANDKNNKFYFDTTGNEDTSMIMG